MEYSEDLIKYDGTFYSCFCKNCGSEKKSFHRQSIRRTLSKGRCAACNPRFVKDSRISFRNNKYYAHCIGCGLENEFTRKPNAIIMLERQSCKSCPNAYEKDARIRISDVGIIKIDKNKWMVNCPKCKREVIYTSSQSAKRLIMSDSGCKECYNCFKFKHPEKEILNYSSYKMFEKGAKCRGIDWELTYEYVCSLWNGKCAISGIDLIDGRNQIRTWSIDRIDNSLGYHVGNIRIIHKRLNIMRGAMDSNEFIHYCIAVADHVKKQYGNSRTS